MPIKKIIIVGGGATVWIAAAAIANGLRKQFFEIHVLVLPLTAELGEIDSSMPSIREFHKTLGINERELMANTGATFKLATQYNHWANIGQQFMHSSSACGRMLNGVEFQHYATLLHECGDTTTFDTYSFSAHLARQNKFSFLTEEQQTQGLTVDYAMHIETELYATYMQSYAQKLGVTSQQADIDRIILNPNDGSISAIKLADGTELIGDFFIDCSGATALLSEALDQAAFESWNHLLLCNKRIQVTTVADTMQKPYTAINAQAQGWLKTTPARFKNNVHYLYSDDFMQQEQAHDFFTQSMAEHKFSNIHASNFRLGKRKKFWNKNCLAVGAAAGDFGDLILSRLHLVQSGILRFLELLPANKHCENLAAEYNQLTHSEYDRILDFHQLHFKLNQRNDSEFWLHAQQIPISDQLTHTMALFKARGKIAFFEHETWVPSVWISFFISNNVWPEKYDPLVNHFDIGKISNALNEVKSHYQHNANVMPFHRDFVERYCSLN